RSMDAIARDLIAVSPGDGDVETGKRHTAEEYFRLLYYVMVGRPDSFAVEVRDSASSAPRRVTVAAVDSPTMKRAVAAASPPGGKPVRIEIRKEPPAAVLRIETFDSDTIERAGVDYARTLDDAFRRIRESGAGALVIDVRDNGGGRDQYGSLLFSHLTADEFRYYDALETRTNKITFLAHTSADASMNDQLAAALDP